MTAVLAGAYGIKLVTTTLVPGQPLVGGAANSLMPFRTIHELLTSSVSMTVATRQLGGNLILLMPLALLACVAGLSRRRAVAAVIATSITIELLQALVVPNRTGDIDDVLLNVGGAGLIVAAAYPMRAALGRSRGRPT